MNRIWAKDRTGRAGAVRRDLCSFLSRAMRALGLKGSEVSLTLVGDGTMRKLNRRWRGKDRTTDVLSFPQGERRVLGDIVISAPQAKRQAEAAGHARSREFRILAAHGLLHLLGHDHEEPGEARRMFRLQERLVRE